MVHNEGLYPSPCLSYTVGTAMHRARTFMWSLVSPTTLIVAESKLKSTSDDSLDKDPRTQSGDVLRHMQSVPHP